MFSIAFIIFVFFTIVYLFFTGAILYHLKQYTLARHYGQKIATTIFFLFSGILWLLALYLLFKIPIT